MARSDIGTINPNTTSGSDLAALLSARAVAEDSGHVGTGRPVYATNGMLYTESSTTPPHIYLAGNNTDGSNDIDLTALFAPPPGRTFVTAEVLLPSGYLWCDGTAFSRTTFATLLNAIAPALTANANSTNVLSGVSADMRTLGLLGAPIEASNIPAGTTITAISATTITLSQATTTTASGVAIRIFPFGNGNGTTTFNVPDLRDRVVAGRGDMNGTNVNLLTVAGSGIDGTLLGADGGLETTTLIIGNLPAHTHTASTSGTTDTAAAHTHTYSGTTSSGGNHNHGVVIPTRAPGTFTNGASSSLAALTEGPAATMSRTTDNSGNHTHSYSGTTDAAGAHSHVLTLATSISNTGSGTAFSNVQPTSILNWIIKT